MNGIIQAYGLFWKADNVWWGLGSKRGALLGVPARATSTPPADFRDQIGVYVLYSGHQIVYVGQTGSGERHRLLKRMKRHRKDALAGRWDHFSWFGLRRVLANSRLSSETMKARATISTVLNHIEAVLIAVVEPSLNRQGGRFGNNAIKYLQVRDDRLGMTESQMLKELWEQAHGRKLR